MSSTPKFIESVYQLGDIISEQAYDVQFIDGGVVLFLYLKDVFDLLPQVTGVSFIDTVHMFADEGKAISRNAPPKNFFDYYKSGFRQYMKQDTEKSSIVLASELYGSHRETVYLDTASLKNAPVYTTNEYNRNADKIAGYSEKLYTQWVQTTYSHSDICNKGPADALMWGCTMHIKRAAQAATWKQEGFDLLIENGGNILSLREHGPDTGNHVPLTQSMREPEALFNLMKICSQFYFDEPMCTVAETAETAKILTDLRAVHNRPYPTPCGKKVFDKEYKRA